MPKFPIVFPFIFDDAFHQSLAEHFALMRKERREMMLRELVPDVAKARQLPNIGDFNAEVPNCIRVRLERLYQGLAAIDYNKRTRDFNKIFRELSVCETILAREKDYIRMIRFRQLWFENRKRKKDKRASSG